MLSQNFEELQLKRILKSKLTDAKIVLSWNKMKTMI